MAGLAVGFLLLATDAIGGGDWALVRALAVCFGVFGVLVLVLSRGRHFAWLLGLGAAATAWAGTL
jgi:Flp pilus assembly protein protease CpaA